MKTFALAAALLLLNLPAWAADKSVSAHDAFAYPTAEGLKTGAVFLTIEGGEKEDRLISATTPMAEHVELHTIAQNEQGVMSMRKVPEIVIPANTKVELKPQSYHLMLMGLTAPLKPSNAFPVTLNFEKAGSVEVQVFVETLIAKEKALNEHEHHNHNAPPVAAETAPAEAAPAPATETSPSEEPAQ